MHFGDGCRQTLVVGCGAGEVDLRVDFFLGGEGAAEERFYLYFGAFVSGGFGGGERIGVGGGEEGGGGLDEVVGDVGWGGWVGGGRAAPFMTDAIIESIVGCGG